MKIKKRHLKKIIILAICLLLCGIGLYIYRLYTKKSNTLKITELWVDVFTDVTLEDMQFMLKYKDDDYGLSYCSPEKYKITESMAPFHMIMIRLTADRYTPGATFSVTDYGEFADNWFYRYNVNGGGSNCYELGLYQGDLTEEEVKRAVYSIKTVYSYTDKNGKYHDIPIEFDSDTTINYEKFAGLNQQ